VRGSGYAARYHVGYGGLMTGYVTAYKNNRRHGYRLVLHNHGPAYISEWNNGGFVDNWTFESAVREVPGAQLELFNRVRARVHMYRKLMRDDTARTIDPYRIFPHTVDARWCSQRIHDLEDQYTRLPPRDRATPHQLACFSPFDCSLLSHVSARRHSI
jgi:hypothetical protein